MESQNAAGQAQSQGVLEETGTHVKSMAQGAADVGKGAAQGVMSIARGAAMGAANVAQGTSDVVKNTFGSNSNNPGNANRESNPSNATTKI